MSARQVRCCLGLRDDGPARGLSRMSGLMREDVRCARELPAGAGVPLLVRCGCAVLVALGLLLVGAGRADAISELQSSTGANTFLNPYNASGMGQKIPADTW